MKRYTKKELVEMSVEAFERVLDRLSPRPLAMMSERPSQRLLAIGGSDEDQIKMLAALILSRHSRSLVTPDQVKSRSASMNSGASKKSGGSKKAGGSQFRSRLKSRAESRAKAAQSKCGRSQLSQAPAPKKQNRKGRP